MADIARCVLLLVQIISFICPLYALKQDFVAVGIDGKGHLNFKNNKTNAVSWGVFGNEVNKTGWAYLEVYSDSHFDDVMQAYAAGLVEGHLTKEMIHLSLLNTGDDLCKDPMTEFCKKLKAYMNVNLQWMYSQISKEAGKDPYWHQVSLFLAQINGLRDGYNGKPGTPTYILADPMDTFLQLQIGGDVEDLTSALGGAGGKQRVLGSGSCSALIKLLPLNRDLYVSQDTWTTFQDMLRILKKYSLQYHTMNASNADVIPGQEMTFPSNPGTLTSGDDFYTVGTGLVTLETTIGNGNVDLWQYVKPTNSVVEGIRSMVANRLCTSGKQWTDMFKKFNSGTYNNEWMVVDYKRFKPGQDLGTDVLWVVEQIPKYVESKDLTSLLKSQQYFPSYNVPYFPDIFKLNGQLASQQKYGDWFSYDKTPRALIFAREHGNVTDMKSMMKLMRYNNFPHDPVAKCDCKPPYSGENGISARSDLNPANMTVPFGALGPRLHGGIDMKVTDSSMSKSLEFVSQLSPTFDDLPPFRWSTSQFHATKHFGMPDLVQFQPITHSWGSRDD